MKPFFSFVRKYADTCVEVDISSTVSGRRGCRVVRRSNVTPTGIRLVTVRAYGNEFNRILTSGFTFKVMIFYQLSSRAK